jgi:hypothetical protein
MNMFTIEKQRLLKSLERVRTRLCGYIGPRCDCKYLQAGVNHHSEQTGCCEVRLAAAVIMGMTDEEFEHALKRAHDPNARSETVEELARLRLVNDKLRKQMELAGQELVAQARRSA